jgi:hypothetical protein
MKWWAIMIIILASILLIAILTIIVIPVNFISPTINMSVADHFYIVPIEASVSATNLKITPTEEISNYRNITINVFNGTSFSNIPKNCSINYLIFSVMEIKEVSTGRTVGETRFGGDGGISIRKAYPIQEIFNGEIPVVEPENVVGTIKKSLSKNEADLKIIYRIDPFEQKEVIHYKKVYEKGCGVTSLFRINGEIIFSGDVEEKIDIHPEQIICLRDHDESKKYTHNSTEDCTFFKIESDVEITIKTDYKNGREHSNPRPFN